MHDEKNKYENHISNEQLPMDFSLEEILAEFSHDYPEVPISGERLAAASKRIVLDAASEASFSSLDQFLETAVEEAVQEKRKAPPRSASPAPEENKSNRRAVDEIILDIAFDEENKSENSKPVEAKTTEKNSPQGSENSEEEEDSPPEIEQQLIEDSDDEAAYAKPDVSEAEPSDDETREAPRGRGRDRFLAPIFSFLALSAIRREQRSSMEAQQAAQEEDDAAEMPPRAAVKFYASQLASIKLRAALAAAMSLVMVYFSVAVGSNLPIFSVLEDSVRALALMLIIIELSVMICALDVFTTGIMNLVRKKFGIETLAAVSCILSIIDAAIVAAVGAAPYGLPFCVISAISMTTILMGSYFTCKAYRTSFRVLVSKGELYTITSESVVEKKSRALLKSRISAYGFIKRSEQADISEYIFGAMSPFLLLASFAFAIVVSVLRGEPASFFHCVSAMAAVCATFSAAVCFAMPFAKTARKLATSGAAIAGWAGARDIGKSRNVVITDNDLFPQGTVEISQTRILEQFNERNIIAIAGSVAMASTSSISSAFSDLLRRNALTMRTVEDFEAHDGGGMKAMVGGENVLVGNSGFMNLMSIRIPQKLNTPNSVFAAVNGELVGIFDIKYKPTISVQSALAVLLRSNNEPVFAIRDFNITPVMIKQKFKMPTDKFEFPSYSERFRISSAEPTKRSNLDAVLSREGMGPLVEVSDRGKRLCSVAKLGAFLSAACAVIALITLFLLFFAKAYDSASVTNILTYMFLWFLPCIVLNFSLDR